MLGELLHDPIVAINGHPLLSLGVLLLPFSYALLLGAIAAATAPAATVVIVRELRARGEFVDYLGPLISRYGIVRGAGYGMQPARRQRR